MIVCVVAITISIVAALIVLSLYLCKHVRNARKGEGHADSTASAGTFAPHSWLLHDPSHATGRL